MAHRSHDNHDNRSSLSVILRAALGAGGIGIMQRVLALLTAMLLARLLGTEGYGQYTFAMSLIGLIAIISQVGLPQLITRETAKFQARADWSMLSGLILRSAQFAAISTSVLGVAVGMGLLLFSDRIAALDVPTFTATLLLMPLLITIAISASFLRGLRKIINATWPNAVLGPGLFLLVLLVTRPSQPDVAVWFNVGIGLIVLTVCLWLLRQAWPEPAMRVTPAFRTRDWLRSLLPFTLIAGVGVINQRADIVLLGALTDASNVAGYYVAMQGASLVAFPLIIAGSVLGPSIAGLYAKKDLENLRTLLARITLLALVVSAAVALVFLLWGVQLIGWAFGNELIFAYKPLTILIFGQIVNVFFGPVALALSMTNHEKSTLFGLCFAVIVNILLNLILIPRMGISGAAIATSTSIVSWNIILGVLVWKHLNIIPGPILFRQREQTF